MPGAKSGSGDSTCLARCFAEFVRQVATELHEFDTRKEAGSRRTDARAGIPVLANVDLGHTDPMLTLAIGVPAILDADALTLQLADTGSAPNF